MTPRDSDAASEGSGKSDGLSYPIPCSVFALLFLMGSESRLGAFAVVGCVMLYCWCAMRWPRVVPASRYLIARRRREHEGLGGDD